MKLWQHNFTRATIVKLLTKGLCSESGLHGLPSRSSRCPRTSIPWKFRPSTHIFQLVTGSAAHETTFRSSGNKKKSLHQFIVGLTQIISKILKDYKITTYFQSPFLALKLIGIFSIFFPSTTNFYKRTFLRYFIVEKCAQFLCFLCQCNLQRC